MSVGADTLTVMTKFDRDGFQEMMAEVNARDRAGVVVRSPYEDMEPDPECLPRKTRCIFLQITGS
ncbi:hypothetical protein [Arthrobacter sp. EpRS71]|uniref:hypothetical protein n=1 Tax=Arthrobacter sp. EpRS71 TaxID=1743141 RepID=UPI00074687D7|nr:hypothetical protein [Arthrobacter sp. EpRS71]KUM36044.1 hypothetical protein AR689_18980 [Arthrobacter sp. EpRS71]